MSDRIERYWWIVVAGFCVPVVAGVAIMLNDRLQDPPPLEIETAAEAGDTRVYIAGAVQNPGVYGVDVDDRWIDVLELAGGPTEDADLININLARHAVDEDQIVVPRLGQAAPAGLVQQALVNINTADEAALEALPGIGKVRARNIVQSRAEKGLFASIDELLVRDLIPESVFEEIAPQITVAP